MTPAPTQIEGTFPTPRRASARQPIASDAALSQYYTQEEIARRLLAVARSYFDFSGFLMVEPSAGTGSFFKSLPPALEHAGGAPEANAAEARV